MPKAPPSSSSGPGPSRPRSRPGGRNPPSASSAPSAATASTPDEALSLGVEAEERGERAAYGEKALRNYEEALGLYLRAYGLDPGGEEAADAAYNAGRVLFLLGTGFYMPTGGSSAGGVKGEALRESVRMYREALARAASTPSGGTFRLDIVANLAAALQAQAEAVLDFGGGVEAHDEARALVQEGVQLLEGLAAEQGAVLRRQIQDEVAAAGAGAQAQAQQQQGEVAPPAAPPTLDGDADGSVQSLFASSLIVPSSLLETYHALHALHLLPLQHGLASTPSDVAALQGRMGAILAAAEDFVRQCDAAQDWGERASPDDEWAQGKSQLGRDRAEGEVAAAVRVGELVLAGVGGDTAAVAAEVEELIQQVLPLAQAHLANLKDRAAPTYNEASRRDRAAPAYKEALAQRAAALPESRRRGFYHMVVEEVLSLSEGGLSLARILLRLVLRLRAQTLPGVQEDTAPPLRLAYTLASTASTALLFVLALLDPNGGAGGGAAAVLGSSHTANPTTLLRCQVLTSLVCVSLLRAHEAFAAADSAGAGTGAGIGAGTGAGAGAGAGAEPAPLVTSKSRKIILDNSRIFAQRALNEVGLSWLYGEPWGQTSPSGGSYLPSPKARKSLDDARRTIPPGGWDALETQGDAVMWFLRASFVRAWVYPTLEGHSPSSCYDMQQGAERDIANVRKGMELLAAEAGAAGGNARASASAVPAAWRLALDVGRFVQAVLVEEEGEEMALPLGSTSSAGSAGSVLGVTSSAGGAGEKSRAQAEGEFWRGFIGGA